jgi:hypothetical protein
VFDLHISCSISSVLITVPDAVVVIGVPLGAGNQFLCVLSICAAQDDTYYLKTEKLND